MAGTAHAGDGSGRAAAIPVWRQPGVLARLHRVHHPTLLLRGDKDRVLPASYNQRFAEALAAQCAAPASPTPGICRNSMRRTPLAQEINAFPCRSGTGTPCRRCYAMIQAVLWDFGGVFTTSPFEAFAAFREGPRAAGETSSAHHSTNPDPQRWARFESSAISVDEFDAAFREEAQAHGHSVAGKDVLELLSGEFRPRMAAALAKCKKHFKVGCITNNMRKAGDAPRWPPATNAPNRQRR